MGLRCRISPVPGGDPTGTGRGGASIYGRQFNDELENELKHTGAGILSMANSGPNSNGSQFFITLAPTQWLDSKHTIFGELWVFDEFCLVVWGSLLRSFYQFIFKLLPKVRQDKQVPFSMAVENELPFLLLPLTADNSKNEMI